MEQEHEEFFSWADETPNLPIYDKFTIALKSSSEKEPLVIGKYKLVICGMERDKDENTFKFKGRLADDFRWYGSGLFQDKSGFGYKMVDGFVWFKTNGEIVLIKLKVAKNYHR